MRLAFVCSWYEVITSAIRNLINKTGCSTISLKFDLGRSKQKLPDELGRFNSRPWTRPDSLKFYSRLTDLPVSLDRHFGAGEENAVNSILLK